METILPYINATFNLLELIIVVWIVRDRKIIAKNLTRLAETVYNLSQPYPQPYIKSVKPKKEPK